MSAGLTTASDSEPPRSSSSSSSTLIAGAAVGGAVNVMTPLRPPPPDVGKRSAQHRIEPRVLMSDGFAHTMLPGHMYVRLEGMRYRPPLSHSVDDHDLIESSQPVFAVTSCVISCAVHRRAPIPPHTASAWL